LLHYISDSKDPDFSPLEDDEEDSDSSSDSDNANDFIIASDVDESCSKEPIIPKSLATKTPTSQKVSWFSFLHTTLTVLVIFINNVRR
jgi:hypothetical protein